MLIEAKLLTDYDVLMLTVILVYFSYSNTNRDTIKCFSYSLLN